ncbi:hypothetical protein CPB86DRAFT_824905 [Serendipita vermifera]|nr:hypothetical protein CPB86DRAFT_824905 [Serendipita vermifera]
MAARIDGGSTFPVEIWLNILLEVAVDSFLTFNDSRRESLMTGIIENLDLFESSCDSYDEYLRNQAALIKLRLVCRSWNIILRDYCHLCSITDLRKIIGPRRVEEYVKKAEKVQLVYLKESSCRCSRPKSPFIAMKTRPCPILKLFRQNDKDANESWSERDIIRRMIHPHVKILTLHSRTYPLTESILSTPNLLALGLSFDRNLYYIPALGQAFRIVTHLSLSLFGEDVEHLPTTLSLPNIRYFSLNIGSTPRSLELNWSFHPFENWHLPRLESVVAIGSTVRNLHHYIRALLKRCGETVTEAIVTMAFQKNAEEFMFTRIQNIWELLPKLRVYGADFFYLSSKNSGPPPRCSPGDNMRDMCPPLTLVITHLHTTHDCRERAARLVNRLPLWNVDKIVFAESWRKLHERLITDRDTREKRVAALYHARHLFNALLTSGVPIYDKHGASLQSEGARPLWDEMHQAHTEMEKSPELEMERRTTIDPSTTLAE